MNEKKTSRIRRARRARFKMRELGAVRLCVSAVLHVTSMLQVISADGGKGSGCSFNCRKRTA